MAAVWTEGLEREGAMASATLQAAEALFTAIVANNPDCAHPSLLRSAVSCLLLEQVCAIFSRYHAVLGSAADTILRSVYLPDTAEMRELVGSLEVPLRLPRSVSQRDADDCHELLRPYGRKTYFLAFEQLGKAVKHFARLNRSIEVRLSRQSKVFESTMKHWMTSLLRNFFASWRNYTRRRNTLRAKYKAVFSRLRSDEMRLRAVRRWRDHAARVKKFAAVDAASASELHMLRQSTTQMQEQIRALTEYNGTVGGQIRDLEAQRQKAQTEIAQMEATQHDLAHRCTEMERLGTDLLDSVLMKEAPPKASHPLESLVAWGHQAIEDTGGMIDGSLAPFAPLLTDEFTVGVPLSAIGCVMLWLAAPSGGPTREQVVALHLSPQTAPETLTAIFERMFNAPCIVTSEQIASGQRGVFLLLLATLMRRACNWLSTPPPPIPRKPAVTLPEAANWSERLKIQQAWIATSLAAQHAALEVAVRRPQVLSAEEQDDLGRFLNIPAQTIADILPKDRGQLVHVQLLRALERLYGDLRKVYYSYALPVMTFMDFKRLMKDCLLLGEKKLSKKICEHTAKRVWRDGIAGGAGTGEGESGKCETTGNSEAATAGAAPTAPPAASVGSSDKDPQAQHSHDDIAGREIQPHHFVELLVRLALTHHRRNARDVSLELAPHHVVSFVSECIVPHALRSDVDRFKQMFRHLHVQQVIAKHKITLRRAFSAYATVSEEHGDSMSRVGFFQMAKDCKWVTKAVTHDVIVDVFRRAQMTESGSLDALDINEWLECVVALAVYHKPNPFVPLHLKLAPFIEESIAVPLQL